MSGAAIVAFGAISAQGEGRDAFSVGAVGEEARQSIVVDDVLGAAGLARPFVARAPVIGPLDPAADPAAILLGRALDACALMLDRGRPGWRALRVGLALGTSSGGMQIAERLFRDPAHDPGNALDPLYFGPVVSVLGRSGQKYAPATLVLGACASSTLAMGIGTRWLAADACDIVLAGGFDAVTIFVAAGFETLRATTSELPPRPFRTERDGMALGEGAGVVALVPLQSMLVSQHRNAARPFGYIAGFAATADAVHVTAPDRTGAGLGRAASGALAEANVAPGAVDLVSAHATSTPFNDAAEWRALVTALGASAGDVPVHPFKAQIGHTLGASGVLETLACLDAFERRILPAAVGHGPRDPDAPARVLDRAMAGEPRAALKLSSAFGGANAALVVTRDAPAPNVRPAHDAYVSAGVFVDREPEAAALAAQTGASEAGLARADVLVRLGVAAVARLAAAHGGHDSLRGAGIVVGQAFATLETNALYFARILERGPRAAEPRRFPYTSPNAVAGECGVIFGLTGLAFAVGGGLHAGVEALAIAAQLVMSGDAERIVVVAVDDVGPVVARLLGAPPFVGLEIATGAVAMLVSRSPAGARARVGSIALALGPHDLPAGHVGPVGHSALLSLAGTAWPSSVSASCPSGGFASVGFLPV